MLQRLNARIQGWIAWFIVILIAFTFVLWGIQTYVTSHSTNHTAIEVNGKEITQNELEATYKRLRNSIVAQQGDEFVATTDFDKQVKQQARQQLINTSLAAQAAEQLGMFIADAQVSQIISQIPAFQQNGVFSERAFLQLLSQNGYRPNEYMDDLKQQTLIEQLQFAVAATAFATETEVSKTLALAKETRQVKYTVIPANQFKVTPSEQDVKKYYDSHKDQFTDQEQVKLAYLELDLNKLVAEQKISQAELNAFYKNNTASFMLPAKYKVATILVRIPKDADDKKIAALKKKAESILKQAKAESFSALAKKYSDDSLSAKKGGELPWFSAGTFAPNFEAAVEPLTLKQPLAPVVRTKYGFTVIKLIGKEDAKQKSFAEVEPAIKKRLSYEKAQREFARMSERLATLSFENPTSLEKAAKELSLAIKTTGFITRSGGDEPITKNKKILTVAFSEDQIEQNNNSDVLQLGDTSVVVLRIAEHKSPQLKPLAEVKQQIIDQLSKKQQRQLAEQQGQQLIKQLQEGAAKDVTWREQPALTRNSKAVDPAISQRAFTVGKGFHGLALANGDYVVLTVKNSRLAKPDDNNKQELQQVGQSLGLIYGKESYQLYIDSQKQAAEIN